MVSANGTFYFLFIFEIKLIKLPQSYKAFFVLFAFNIFSPKMKIKTLNNSNKKNLFGSSRCFCCGLKLIFLYYFVTVIVLLLKNLLST